MKRIATILAVSAVMAFASAAVHAQAVPMPADVLEAGFDDVLLAPPLAGPVGGTIAPEAGGAVQIGGDSGTGLVSTPQSDAENAPADD